MENEIKESMNDIEILEKTMKALKKHDLNYIMINFNEIAQAIENLLKRNKELEKLKEKHNVRINDLCAMVDNLAYDNIPKSLVREKIEEINNIFDMGEEWYNKEYIIEILQDLLNNKTS